MSRRVGRVRRLVRDLRRRSTRSQAVHRVVAKVTGRKPGVPGGTGKAGPSSKGGTSAGTRAAAAAQGQEGTRQPAWYVGEWGRLASVVTDRTVDPAEAANRSSRNAINGAARRARGQAVFTATMAAGGSLEEAVLACARDLSPTDEWGAAWTLAEAVGRRPEGRIAKALGHTVVRHGRGQLARGWIPAATLEDGILRRHIPVEAVDAALADGSPEARTRALAIGTPDEQMPPAVLIDLAGRFLAVGEREQAALLVAELRRRPGVEVDDRRRYAWSLIEGWLGQTGEREIPEGSIAIGIVDYKTPDPVLASGNVGDYVQSLGLLGTLVRIGDLQITGENGLGEVATALKARVDPALKVPGPSASVHLVPVDRDFTTGCALPDGTWLPAFGWHMHPLFDLRYDFPYHPHLRPVFLSFHVNRLDMLSEEALAYLRRYGPVGCRDWSTVWILLSAGVDAFFSGCLTSTVDALFPARSDAYAGGATVGVIDQNAGAAGRGATDLRHYTHQDDRFRYMTAAEGVRAADALLGEYQRDLARVVTSRLHAYLPLTSLGVPVDFKPWGSPGDVRFAGLAGLGPDSPGLRAMRDGLREITAAVFGKILAGAPEDEVYAHWRTVTAPLVAEAKARFTAPGSETPTGTDVAAAVAASWKASRRFGPHEGINPANVADVVLCFDQNLTSQAPVVIESLVANATGPVRLWVLTRGVPPEYQPWLAAAFPDLPITFLPCDGVTYGVPGRPLRIPARITISTMDRILLPHMLENVSRVVYMDVDTLVLGDITELFRMDMSGHAVGARDSNVSEASEWQRAGRPLPEPVASDLRRRLGALHGFGSRALNAGLLVMDLDRMRADDFTRTYLGWAERYGFHDQDTMLAYAGPNRLVLEQAWNAMPVIEEVSDPKLIHWASFPKPWDPAITFEQETWRTYADRVRERAGPPPTADPTSTPGSIANPIRVGPQTARLDPDLERVIKTVKAENLSYLDTTSLRTLAACMREADERGVEGVVLETGTARGGSAITLAAAKAPGRRMRIYDVFGMIPPPGEKDGADVHKRYATIVAGESNGIGGETYYGYRDDLYGEVVASFARLGHPVDARDVELFKGLFEDTLVVDEPVALAHLDGDWYASTMTCLERISPRLAVGGRIVMDDYDSWSGCRAAVQEYFRDKRGYRFERRGRLHIVRV